MLHKFGGSKTMEKKLTIRDIAKLSGVSASTVSRVLDDSDRISAETKKSVLEVVNQYGYKPQAAARNLARQKTSAIGIIIPQNDMNIYSSSFFQEALHGVSNSLSQNGYDVLISSGNPTELDAIKRLISTSRIDGIILLRSVVNDASIQYLTESKFPFVLIGTCLENPDVYSVDNDNQRAAYDIAYHMYMTGKRKMAIIGGTKSSVFIQKRLEGYEKLLVEKGLPINQDYIKLENASEDYGYQSMLELLKSPSRPDSVLVMDDSICVGVMKAINESGVKIPEEIAVACFNESSFTKYSRPALTTISLNFYDLGYCAAKTLLSVLNNEPIQKGCRYVDHLLTIRESTVSN
ncbi:MAG: LacI family transcriptional regulator [Ruminococcaceae bacterium]|nr:LacI family transcriptional regulator [Oscillospiraceae bacterium]